MTFADIIASAQQGFQNIGNNLQGGNFPSPFTPRADPLETKRVSLLDQRADSALTRAILQKKLNFETDKNRIFTQAKKQGYIPQASMSLNQIANKAQKATQPKPTTKEKVKTTRSTDIPSYENLLAMVVERAKLKGYHPAPIAGQFASESARGTSNFAKNRNNYWGLGAFGNDLDNTWDFRTPEDSIDAYFNLIEKDPRYSEAYSKRADPEAYIRAVAPIYAEDPNYVNTIMNTPEWRAQF